MGSGVARNVGKLTPHPLSPEGNAELVRSLAEAIGRADGGITGTKGLVQRVVVDDAWRYFILPSGTEVSWPADAFAEFVTAHPLQGLGTDVATVRRLCEGDMYALDALDAALQTGQRPHGDDRHSDSFKSDFIRLEAVPVSHEAGTSQAYALRRLRAQAPAPHARVLAGEISPHRAMVAAGLRRRTFTVPADDVAKAVAVVRRHFTFDELAGALLDGADGDGGTVGDAAQGA